MRVKFIEPGSLIVWFNEIWLVIANSRTIALDAFPRTLTLVTVDGRCLMRQYSFKDHEDLEIVHV